jgi:hypothetical protein
VAVSHRILSVAPQALTLHRSAAILLADINSCFGIRLPTTMGLKSSLEDYLALEPAPPNAFRSTKPLWTPEGNKGIFGGALSAQALNAAMQTVDVNLHVHSLHAYFISPSGAPC